MTIKNTSSLRELVRKAYYQKFGCYPDLENPTSYNDKIQWLKVNDQMYEHVICCDKLLVRGLVSSIVGEGYLLNIYQVSRSTYGLDHDKLPEFYVLKSNHDSGSVHIIKSKRDFEEAEKVINRKLNHVYGATGGEWGYSHVYPYVFAEEFMEGDIIDFKFHCCSGSVKWVQIISERHTGKAVEVNVDVDYKPIGMHLDSNMTFSLNPPPRPECWREMINLAERLSAKFKYIRVDLYNHKGKPVVGELTSWPYQGFYTTDDNMKFGEMLDFDMTSTRMMLHDQVSYQRRKPSFRRRVKNWLSSK
ncbi:ATP-grasp fold amidoligase family protein [Pseudovibrio exalbescens]|uniref:TupA-like ATPgrasp n=1 Tax=Pseudovibrio exalbescens TaxID=197461 RepID=A0A1U7JJ55_9HYPH|nr:ATP-grasp fold amidoligase family protein [Pseudovibrio exalbescens]OKL44776.1 hypothetical protein A3843_06765 [Pseudovibrio exalbescens]